MRSENSGMFAGNVVHGGLLYNEAEMLTVVLGGG